MKELDALFRDLEAGLFLQGKSQPSVEKQDVTETQLTSGLLSLTFDRRRFEPVQALIGRDFVAWADAQGMYIVPGRLASIRVDKGQRAQHGELPSFAIQHKLTLAKYLRRLTGQSVQLEMARAQNLAGTIRGVKGTFALIELGSAIAFVDTSSITRITLPVHNFSERLEEGLR